jgi:hypothetical protein
MKFAGSWPRTFIALPPSYNHLVRQTIFMLLVMDLCMAAMFCEEVSAFI